MIHPSTPGGRRAVSYVHLDGKNPAMKKPHTTRMPAAHCPHCSHLIDAATYHDGAAHTPSPGDWSVCFGCGGLLRFNADLTQVAGLASDLAWELPAFRRLIQRMQRHVRERNRQY